MNAQETILVAEDNPEDAFFLQRAFGKKGFKCKLEFVRDGQEVLDYLQDAGQAEEGRQHPVPDLLLLDLKMPRLNGFDVLKWLRRKEERLRRLPVVIFTSSGERLDIDRAYDLGANAYVVKPHDGEKLEEIVALVGEFWIELNERPREAGG